MKSRSRRAITLLEAMVSITLFTMVMFLMANLMNAASQSEKFLGEKDRIHEVSVSLLYRMAYEVRTANRWLEPITGSSNQLRFECPDWQLEPVEFPASPTPFPTSWTPGDPAFQAGITYTLNGTQLERRLTAESQVWTTQLLRDCQQFLATRESPSSVRLNLTVLSRGAPKELMVRVLLPQEVWVPK